MPTVTVVHRKPQLVIGIRKKGSYREIAELLPRLYTHAASKGARFAGMPTFVFHESAQEARAADAAGTADLEVAAPIASEVEVAEGMACYTLPGGTMARIVHKGPYDQCQASYDVLFAWLARNGKKLAGPLREVYLNDPQEAGLDDALTEILAPIGP